MIVKFEHKIDKDKQTVTVKGTLTARKLRKVVIRDKQVREYLVRNNIPAKECVSSNTLINSEETKSAEWVFRLDNVNKKVVKSNSDKEVKQPKKETNTRKRKNLKIRPDTAREQEQSKE